MSCNCCLFAETNYVARYASIKSIVSLYLNMQPEDLFCGPY